MILLGFIMIEFYFYYFLIIFVFVLVLILDRRFFCRDNMVVISKSFGIYFD